MMLHLKGIIILTGVLSMLMSGWAEEDKFTESKSKDFALRASIGSAPGISEFDIDGVVSFDADEDAGVQLEALIVQRFWSKNNPAIGGIIGGGAFFANNNGSEKGGSDEAELTAFGLIGQGGLALKLGQVIIIELVPYAGIGAASVEITGFDDGGGTYLMYGVKGGIFVLLGETIELGIEVGYQAFKSDFEIDVGPFNVDAELTGDGVRGALVLAIKM